MYHISLATIEDAVAILALQKLAYQSEAKIYGDFSIPPLMQTQAEMETDLRTQVVVKAMNDEEIIASARAFEQEGTIFIGRVIVHPRLQGQGLGKQIMAAIESRFPHARRFELFTGHRSIRNLNFYRGLGYQEFKTMTLTADIQFVFLEKRLTHQGSL